MAALLLMAAPPKAHGLPQSGSDFYLNRGQRVALMVRLDRIGILFPIAGDSLNYAFVADRFHLRVRREFPEGVTELDLGDSPPREEIVAMARRIRREMRGRVMNAGLIVSLGRGGSPMIVSDEISLLFRPGAKAPQIDSLFRRLGVRVVNRNPFQLGQYLVELPDTSSLDALRASQQIDATGLSEYAVPNFIHIIYSTQSPWDQPMYGRQWHLENDGSASGTADADIDARKAWDITQGAPSIVVAVIDRGFDIHHEDLKDNLWVNEACDGSDNDTNGFVDDVHGWDYFGCVPGCGSSYGTDRCVDCDAPSPVNCGAPYPQARCGDLDLSCTVLVCEDMHGTAVAGLIAANGTNDKGGTGVAPSVRLMLLRRTTDEDRTAQCFDYARSEGADVINCSWHLADGQPLTPRLSGAIALAATQGRGGKGCVIAYAMSNQDTDDCGSSPTTNQEVLVVSRSNTDQRDAVIAVSSSDEKDQKVVNSGYGNCMDVLAPSQASVASDGHLKIATTDWSGTVGFNYTPAPCKADCPNVAPLPAESPEDGYTYCFGGTSAATAIVSGVAALILSAEPGMTQPQVKLLLQDTADKTEDQSGGTRAGNYGEGTGFSDGPSGTSTHGWGRINAFEAVRVAAPATMNGRGGVDVFSRDQVLDWGNTEQPSSTVFEPSRKWVGHWESVDIKVDAGPVWQTRPTDSAMFDGLADEEPAPGALNRIYVRVRNRGFRPASAVTVKVHWAYVGTMVPRLPEDFWSQFPADPTTVSEWNPIGTDTVNDLGYSGCSATRAPETDGARVAQIDFQAPPSSATLPTHYCLLVVLSAPEDPPDPKRRTPVDSDRDVDHLTPADNNVVQKNIVVHSSLSGLATLERFFVTNATVDTTQFFLKLTKPKGWGVTLNPRGPYRLKPGERRLVTAKIRRKGTARAGSVVLVQEERKNGAPTPLGGLTLRFSAPGGHK